MTADLIASLTATATHGLYLDDDRYLDWSSQRDDGSVYLEVGNEDGDCVTLDLTETELRALHAALTATLLARAAR